MRRYDDRIRAMRLVCLFLLFCVVAAQSKRRLLDEQIASAVDAFRLDDDSAEKTAQSIGRMLLAFKALEKLKPAEDLLGQSAWRDSLIDTDKLDPLNIKDLGSGTLLDAAASGVDGAADAVSSLINTKNDLLSNIASVATGDLSFEQAAEGQVSTLARYLNAYIERETKILDAYSKGHPDDQPSFLLEAPQATRYVNDILKPFGVLDSTSLVNLTASLQERFCSPMVFLPRRFTGKRTVINGPAFELTLSTGGCEMRFNYGEDKLPMPTLPKHKINCSGHSISYTKTPVSIHQLHMLPEAFSSSQCKVEREFGTEYEKILYGGGPLIRFKSVDDLIDALVAKKYNVFGGLNDLIDQDLTASTLNDRKRGSVEDIMEFWGAFGPGRLLKEKKIFAEKALKEFSLPSLLDIAQTSPFGFGLRDEAVPSISKLNLGDNLFSLPHTTLFSKLKERQHRI